MPGCDQFALCRFEDPASTKEKARIDFRKLVVNKCQTEFENGVRARHARAENAQKDKEEAEEKAQKEREEGEIVEGAPHCLP